MTTKNPTDGNLLFLNQEGGSCVTKHEQRISESLHLLFFASTPLRRDFSLLDCAAGTQSRANQFGLLRDCEGDHFQPHNRQRFASRSLAKTALFSVSTGEQAIDFLQCGWSWLDCRVSSRGIQF